MFRTELVLQAMDSRSLITKARKNLLEYRIPCSGNFAFISVNRSIPKWFYSVSTWKRRYRIEDVECLDLDSVRGFSVNPATGIDYHGYCKEILCLFRTHLFIC